MPTIDDFVRPSEWVSEFVCDMGKAIREMARNATCPSASRSRRKAAPIPSARRLLASIVLNTTNRQGWRLCADGAQVAVSRIRSNISDEMAAGEKCRTERRVRINC